MSPIVSDTLVRAVTFDGSFRVIAAITTSTTSAVLRTQAASGATAAYFGQLLTGTILVREAMAPNLRVQGIVRGSGGKGSIVADSHPDGTTRGVMMRASDNPLELGKGALLQMMRTLPNGATHQGVVEVPEGGGINGALMNYMQESEQIVSVIDVATRVEDDVVQASGGYIVELLPEVQKGVLMVMTERLASFAPMSDLLAQGLDADGILEELLHAMPFERTARSELSFACKCSELRLIEALATLPRDDIEDLAKGDAPLEIRCEYCTKDYAIMPHQLRSMLASS